MLSDKDKQIIKLLKEKTDDENLVVLVMLYIKQENNTEEFRDKVIEYINSKEEIIENDIIRDLFI